MSATIPDFTYHRVPVADGVALNTAVAGSGPPIVLLHGFPQTHLMWRHVATDLATDHTVICPDLRGYGTSDKPAETGPVRTTAAERGSAEPALGGLGVAPQMGMVRTTATKRGSAESAPRGLGGVPQMGMVRTTAAERRSGEPASGGLGGAPQTGSDTYSKRTMAADVVALARAFGHERFALAGHDRGALVAFRAGLDHPGTITHLACLDVLPTLDMWDVMRGVSAVVGFHLYLMAQPPGLPERLIGAEPDAFFGFFLDQWAKDPSAIPAETRAAYLAASRAAIPSIVADYRASSGIDVQHDTADRTRGTRLQMPVTVIQQDWGTALGYEPTALWRPWTTDLHHHTTTAGHFMAEESPTEITQHLRSLLTR